MLHLVLTIFLATDFGGGFGSVKFSVANPYGPAAGDIDMQGYELLDTAGSMIMRSATGDFYLTDYPYTRGIRFDANYITDSLNITTFAGGPLNVYVTGTIIATSMFTLSQRTPDNGDVFFGNSFDTVFSWRTEYSPDGMVIGLSPESRMLYIMEKPDYIYPITRPLQANPTIHIHSSDIVTETWLELTHDQTNAILDAGVGNIELKDPLQVPTYTVDQHVVAGSATLGPTAPSRYVNGSISGIGFAADGESAYIAWEVPDCWVGAENILLKVYWTNQSGDALLDTETVKWDFTYRVLDFGTDTSTTGTAVTITSTYTQSGAGTNGDSHVNTLTLAYNDANQPLIAGEVVTGRFDRDVTGDTYSGAGVVSLWEFSLSANGICDHF